LQFSGRFDPRSASPQSVGRDDATEGHEIQNVPEVREVIQRTVADQELLELVAGEETPKE
jgi:hypothetical protein